MIFLIYFICFPIFQTSGLNSTVTTPNNHTSTLNTPILVLHPSNCRAIDSEVLLVRKSIRAAINHLKENFPAANITTNNTCHPTQESIADVLRNRYLQENFLNRSLVIYGGYNGREEDCKKVNVLAHVVFTLLPSNNLKNDAFLVSWQCEVRRV